MPRPKRSRNSCLTGVSFSRMGFFGCFGDSVVLGRGSPPGAGRLCPGSFALSQIRRQTPQCFFCFLPACRLAPCVPLALFACWLARFCVLWLCFARLCSLLLGLAWPGLGFLLWLAPLLACPLAFLLFSACLFSLPLAPLLAAGVFALCLGRFRIAQLHAVSCSGGVPLFMQGGIPV